ncbi:hypothetical protein ENH_00063910 [Eimeria necatrix]|uniref:Uncharacterized protein n=1 Tax=Eimeria necatrix TaxID=51315 RepID=U6MJ00_9EIME|nr:hypothetical protein ENH_00063910 [Eimeria necatrix]CDJ64212.1 hypothetical protein ENH_00063910 [Eimeria necatrix]
MEATTMRRQGSGRGLLLLRLEPTGWREGESDGLENNKQMTQQPQDSDKLRTQLRPLTVAAERKSAG